MTQFDQQSGFVAGTLVHTDKGLVPIQDIKIGDMVLSSPELSTGTLRVYKRVVNTFHVASKEIRHLGVHFIKSVDNEALLVREFFYLTKNIPIYLVESAWYENRSGRWNAASELQIDDTILLTTQEGDSDSTFYVTCCKTIERIDERHGFCEEQKDSLDLDNFIKIALDGSTETLGYWQIQPSGDEIIKGSYREFDHRGNEDRKLEENFLNRKPPCPNLEAPIYNFQVEDFHTYFVGELGLWVHDASANIS